MGKDRSSKKPSSLSKNDDSGGKKDDVKVANNKKGKISKYGRIPQQHKSTPQQQQQQQHQRKLVKVFEKVSTSSASSAPKDKRNKGRTTPTSQEEDNKPKRKNGRRRRRKPQDTCDEGGFVSLNFNPDNPIITNVQQQNDDSDHNDAKRHHSDINTFRDDSNDNDNNDRRKRQRRGKRKRKSMDDDDVAEGASSSKATRALDDNDDDNIADELLMTTKSSKSSGRKTKKRMEREMERKKSIALKKIKKLGKRNAQEECIRAIVEQQQQCDASSFFKDMIHQNMKKKSIMNTIYNDDSSSNSSAADDRADQDYVPYNMPWLVGNIQQEMLGTNENNENDDVVLNALDYELNAFGTYVRLSKQECHVRQQIIYEINTVAQNLFECDVDVNLLSSSTRHVRFHSITSSSGSSTTSNNNIDNNNDDREQQQNVDNGMSINTCNGINNRHPVHFQVFGSFATQEVCIYSSDIDLALHGVLPSLSLPSALTPNIMSRKNESRKGGTQQQHHTPTNELSIEYVKKNKNDTRKLEQYEIIIKNDNNQMIDEATKLKSREGMTYNKAILISSTSEDDEVDDESNGKVKGIQVISDISQVTSHSMIHTVSNDDLFCIDRIGDKLTEKDLVLRTAHEDNNDNNNITADDNRQMISRTQFKNEQQHQITTTSFENPNSNLEGVLKMDGEQEHNYHSITTREQQVQSTSTSTSGYPSSTEVVTKEPEESIASIYDQVVKEQQQQTLEVVTTTENPSTAPATTESDKIDKSGGSIVGNLGPETRFGIIKGSEADDIDYPVTDLRSDELQSGERKTIVAGEDHDAETNEVKNCQGLESKDGDINDEDNDVSDDDTADKMESFTTESHAAKTQPLEEDVIIPNQEIKMGFSFKDQGWETKNACSNNNAKLLQRKVTLTASTDDDDSSACFVDDNDSDSIDNNNNTEVCFSSSGIISNVKTPAMMIKEMFMNDPCTISAQKLKDMSVDKLGRLWRTLRQTRRLAKSIQFIRKARVPIIKIMTHYGFETDIAVAGNNGTDTSLYAAIQVQTYQSFSAVVLFLKVLLAQNDLDAPFTGGLGSYKLYVLVAFHIQNHLSRGGTDRPGEVLLSFLYRYGGGHHKNMKQKRNSYQDDDQSLVTFLSQDTPLHAICNGPDSNNAGAASGTADLSNVYRLDSVVNLFRRCWELLINRMRVLHRNDYFQRNDTKRCMDRLPSFLTGMVDADRLQFEREECYNLMDCDITTVSNGGSRSAKNNIRGGQQQQRNYPLQRPKTVPKRKSHEPFAFKRNTNINHNNARNNNNFNNSNKKMNNNKNQQGDRSAKELLKSYNATVEDVRRYSNNNYTTPNKRYRRY